MLEGAEWARWEGRRPNVGPGLAAAVCLEAPDEVVECAKGDNREEGRPAAGGR